MGSIITVKSLRKSLILLALCLFASTPALRAAAPLPDAPQPPAATAPQPVTKSQRDLAQQQVKTEEQQRILGIVPNFNEVINGKFVPLNTTQKMNLVYHSMIDPFQFAAPALLAGVSELTGSNSGYGWGPAGFFKRYGANLADAEDGSLLGNGLFPILLHQDARYFRKGNTPPPDTPADQVNPSDYRFRHRILYAAATTFICKGDNGKWQPNYSNVLGNLAAGGISNLYYPQADRGAALTFENAATVTIEGSLGSIFEEFWPDIDQHLFHKHDKN